MLFWYKCMINTTA